MQDIPYELLLKANKEAETSEVMSEMDIKKNRKFVKEKKIVNLFLTT